MRSRKLCKNFPTLFTTRPFPLSRKRLANLHATM
jgi:hypothetical protein